MRKFLIPIVAAASAVTIAAPAAAQWAPPVYRYQPYNFGGGFSGQRFAQSMQGRVERLRGDIHAMAMRRILGPGEARELDREARNLQRRIFNASRNGIQPGEARNVENRIRRLEMRISREARDWDGRPGRHRY